MVGILHYRDKKLNLLTLLWDPLEELEPVYNVTEPIFFSNFNYYLGSVINI